MSYSRWGSSCWYTFWCCSDTTKKEDEIFDICGLTSFTYGELTTKGLDECIKKIKCILTEEGKKLSESHTMFVAEKFSDDEYDELKIYMKRFIKDVDKEYNEKE